MSPQRRKGPSFPRSIRSRLMLWFVLAAVGAVLPGTAVVYVSGLQDIQTKLAQNFCQTAEQSARNFENRLLEELQFIQEVSNDTLTTQVMIERQMMGGGGAVQSTKVQEAHPQLSFRLQVFKGLRSSAMKRLSIYDLNGHLVGDSNLQELRVRDNGDWYPHVKRYWEYFRYIRINEAGTELIMATPIWEGLDIFGYALGEYSFSALGRESLPSTVRGGDGTDIVAVLDAKGRLYHDASSMTEAFPIPQDILEILPKENDTAPVLSKSFLMQNTWDRFSVWEQVACIAPLNGINSHLIEFDLPSWGLLVTQSPAESYATLFGSIQNFIIAGFIGALVAAMAGILMAWRITAPLKNLEDGVHRFAAGERNFQFDARDGDEVGDLAREINRMAQRVEASERELKAFAMAVENSADAIVMTTPNGRIYYTNSSFEKVTGYTREEAVGNKPSMLRVKDTPKSTYESLWHAIASKQPWRGELWNRRKDGEIYPVELTVSPVLDERDEIVSILGVHRDITLARQYREKLEREVEERSRQIVETEGLTAVGRMASMIAHDLRNALSTVKMNLQILSRRHADSEDVEHEYCRIGLGQVRYMEDFLTDILSYARPSNLQCGYHDLNALIDEALSAVSLQAVDKQVELSFDEGLDLEDVYCDRSKLMAVLRNLIDNAILAMPMSGTLLVMTERLDDETKPQVQISITDTGTGIEEDDLGNVFEPFFTTRTKGTGLGLAIAKRTIGQHGGEISVSSTLGKGTTFKLTLPQHDIQDHQSAD